MDLIDAAVKQYLAELLSTENQERINQSLREYAKNERDRVKAFNESIKKQIDEKQKQIDSYMATLGSGLLPKEVIADIGEKMMSLKNEMQSLKETPVPKNYTVPQVLNWLESLRNSTDTRRTVELLVERIEATKTAVHVESTLTTVLGEHGCGDRI